LKYLIAGLGNIGDEYQNTRHNIGFRILDAFAEASNIVFRDKRYGFITELKYKARTFILLKPSTFMNRSGFAIQYWMKASKIPIERMLILTDDVALPFGKIRLKAKGSDGGHNGLKHIQQTLATTQYARLRFGVGNEFLKGQQINYVLGEFSKEEEKLLPERIETAVDIIKCFGTIGIEHAMNQYNNK
jgi:PTH1 family peptidyl-tRNA hydrolase